MDAWKERFKENPRGRDYLAKLPADKFIAVFTRWNEIFAAGGKHLGATDPSTFAGSLVQPSGSATAGIDPSTLVTVTQDVADFLGVEHGTAMADVLFGLYNPSGRLPVSFPRVTGQVPIYYNHKPTGRPPAEDDQFTSKYIDVPWAPLWTFGHGLSYTRFEYSNLRLSADRLRASDSVNVSVGVTNRGQRLGDEVVQLYLRDDAASVTRPVRALKGFHRLTLHPGETRTVIFTLQADDLALYDLTMRKVVAPGGFTVWQTGHSITMAACVTFGPKAYHVRSRPTYTNSGVPPTYASAGDEGPP